MISGYCWPQSARAGETVTLFVSTDGARFDVRVVRQGAKDEQVLHREGLAGVRHEIPIDVSTAGCGWPGAGGRKRVREFTDEGYYQTAFYDGSIPGFEPDVNLEVIEDDRSAAFRRRHAKVLESQA